MTAHNNNNNGNNNENNNNESANANVNKSTKNCMGVSVCASPLASLKATRAVLDEFGLSTKKSLGQNFLVNDDVIQKIISLSGVSEEDRVLEVGPGIGTLTLALLANAAHVTSIERDARLVPVLQKTTSSFSQKFTLIQKDALHLNEKDFQKEPSIFISNLPYAVAATLILDYFQRFESIKSATVMVQKEVAQRICARPGSKIYGAYTVKLNMYARAKDKFLVGPGNFFPPPHVDSAVVHLQRECPCDSSGNALTPEERECVCKMADAAFSSRRKTLANSFKAYFASRNMREIGSGNESSEKCLASLFECACIDPKRRGETLCLQEFVSLARAFLSLKINLS